MFTLEKDTVEYFNFKVAGTRTTCKVPLLRYLTMDLALEAADLQNKSDEETMYFVKKIFDMYAPDVVGSLTVNEFSSLSQAYFEASGINMGE